MTNDEKYQYWIEEVEREIARLKDERKRLNKHLIANKQSIASMTNTLRKLKDERKRAQKLEVSPE